MPLYEYRCPECDNQFDLLRLLSESEAEATCPLCGNEHASRTLSLFAAVSKDSANAAMAMAAPTSSGGGCCGGACGCSLN